MIKNSRWLLLRNAQFCSPRVGWRSRNCCRPITAISVVYLMRDELKALWHYRYAAAAEKLWRQWYHRAIRSRIEPLKQFARRLKPCVPGILAYCRYPLGANLIEVINNNIKVIKRIAYGFRDDHYFFLKIRAAFPGIG